MDEDRISGMADKAVGSVKSAVGNATGDAKLQAEGTTDRVAGAARNAAGGAKDAIREAADTVSEKASAYGREARDVVVAGSENVSQLMRGYPLVTVGVIGVLGFLLGRATAPEPWYRRNWR